MGLPQGKDTCQQAGIPPEPPRIADSPMRCPGQILGIPWLTWVIGQSGGPSHCDLGQWPRFPLVGAGSGQCQASIMPSTVAGPIGCTKDSLPQIPDAQAMVGG